MKRREWNGGRDEGKPAASPGLSGWPPAHKFRHALIRPLGVTVHGYRSLYQENALRGVNGYIFLIGFELLAHGAQPNFRHSRVFTDKVAE